MATTWFMERGYMVSVPLEPARYDLIAESDEGLKRIQVKTTRAHTVGIGRTVYGTGTSPSTGRYGRGVYAPGEIDLFFIYTWDRRSYLIPLEAVQGQMTLNLQKYESYRLSHLDERVQAPPPARQRKSRARRQPGSMPG